MCPLHLLTIEIVAYLYVSHFFLVSLYNTVSDLRVVYAYHYQRRQQKQLLLLRTFFFLFFVGSFVFFIWRVCECVRTIYRVAGSQCCHLVCFYVESWTETSLRDICMQTESGEAL